MKTGQMLREIEAIFQLPFRCARLHHQSPHNMACDLWIVWTSGWFWTLTLHSCFMLNSKHSFF